jgi:SAM-dependent methyltransferase
MKPLKAPLEAGRTLEGAWNHYQVESAIARRLMQADREERKRIFATMYDELFAAVPDHPRLTRREDPSRTAAANRHKLRSFGPFVRADDVVVEFAPGDCEFSAALAPKVRKIIGVDISDQRKAGKSWPANFELVIYDGYALPQIAPGSVDVVFSDQFLEHLHPDDAEAHLALVNRILKPGGRYVIATPHAQSGPWDVSRHFSDVAEGFHLKEWTYTELAATLRRLGYSGVEPIWSKRGITLHVPLAFYRGVETLAPRIGKKAFRRVAKYVAPMVFCVAKK